MTEKSAFWTTSGTGDGPAGLYAQDRMQDVMRTLSTIDPTLYYVAPARLNEYTCSATPSPLSVNTGEAFVNGRHHLADAAVSVAVPTPTTSTRIDRIILRSDGTAQTVRVARLAGTEGSGVPPTLTQNSTTYEVSLWKVTITTGGVISLVDERGWMGLRGLADGTTLEWDTTNKKLRIKDAGVSAAKLASDAVTTVKILDANVTTAKIADGAITTAKITDAQVNAAKLASDAVTTVKILDGAVTTAKHADLSVTNGKIADGAITTNKITDFQVNAAKLAADAVTTVKILDGAITTSKITDGQVNTAKLADDSVDDTKVGARVPQFYRRQGGSATDWNVANTANYTPAGGIRMQAGVYSFSTVLTTVATGGFSGVTATATFPQAYSAKPWCIIGCVPTGGLGLSQVIAAYPLTITTTTVQFLVYIYNGSAGTATFTADIQWLAIGPE